MRAFALSEFGTTPSIVDLDVPEPLDGEVRVRVHAASVNGFDLAVASGYLNGMMEHRFPVVLGKDFAGTVDALGAGVTDYAIGDRVFGVVTKPFLGDGSFGEYVTVPTAIGLERIPDSIDFRTAAALGLAGTAAIDGFDAASLGHGDIVLVAGATGGVGSQVVQLAIKAGATVIATAHTDAERAQVAALGAAEIVDYTRDVAAQVLAAHADGVGVIVHLAGDASSLLPALAKGGRVVSTLLGSPDALDAPGVTVVPVMANPTRETLGRISANTTDGDTTITVQKVYGLDEVGDAFADFGRGTVGKLVVAVVE